MTERKGQRTLHLIVPWTGHALCGYEEEPGARAAEAETVVPCPECSALLRSGVLVRRLADRTALRPRSAGPGSGATRPRPRG
jgi:hypothetical protein